MWRRDRDSNPGWAQTHNGFRDRPVRPLRHLSASVVIVEAGFSAGSVLLQPRFGQTKWRGVADDAMFTRVWRGGVLASRPEKHMSRHALFPVAWKALPMLARMFAPLLLIVAFAAPLQAGDVDGARVAETMQISEMIEVMQAEGIAYGTDLEEQLFPEAGGARWDAIVALIYDRATLESRFTAAFIDRLGRDPALLGAIDGFFGSERGQRILKLELEARRALLDTAVEEAAQVAADEMRAMGDRRFESLLRFAEANDLIEQNVSGALNANLAFYRGMAEGGAFQGAEMTEEEMLSEVWSQEADIRAETEAWLYPYLMLAYEPLSDEEMQAYLAFSDTPAADLLNTALFGAFDEVFGQISHDLGRGAAEMLSGQDI